MAALTAVAGGVAAVLAGGSPVAAITTPSSDSGSGAVVPDLGSGAKGEYGRIKLNGNCLTANESNVQVHFETCLAVPESPASASRDFMFQAWQVDQGHGPEKPKVGYVGLQNAGAGLRTMAEAAPGVKAYNPFAWRWLGTDVFNSMVVPSMKLAPDFWAWRWKGDVFALWNHRNCTRWYLLDHGLVDRKKAATTYMYQSNVPVGPKCAEDKIGPLNFPPPESKLNGGQMFEWQNLDATPIKKYIQDFDARVQQLTYASASLPVITVQSTLAFGGNNSVGVTWSTALSGPYRGFPDTVPRAAPIVVKVTVQSGIAPLSAAPVVVFNPPKVYVFNDFHYCGPQLAVTQSIVTSVAVKSRVAATGVDVTPVNARLTVSRPKVGPRALPADCGLAITLTSP